MLDAPDIEIAQAAEARAPRRLQLSRRRGAKLPAGAISVARPGRWGNPFRISHEAGNALWWVMVDRNRGIPFSTESAARRSAVTMFRQGLAAEQIDQARRELRGHDLACYCGPAELCHADVLLEIANGLERADD